MPFPRLMSTVRLAAVASLFAALTIAGWSQDVPATPTPQNTHGSGRGAGSELWPAGIAFSESDRALQVSALWLRRISSNTARIDQLMHDGKLYLSLNDAIALALENNLDIAIARYNLNIADTDVLRAKAGAAILGVPLGVVQNTPGGGVGGVGAQVGSGTWRDDARRGRRRCWRGWFDRIYAGHGTADQQL